MSNKKDQEMKDTLDEFKLQLDNICPYKPYFELALFDYKKYRTQKEEYMPEKYEFDDDEDDKDVLYNEVQRILNDEAYSGCEIKVSYTSWEKWGNGQGRWARTERVLLSMKIPIAI